MNQRRARRKPGENRERLIEAGLTEFGLFGFHGASTAAIAARAGVPQPHVYANFPNKHALFVETCAAAAHIVRTHPDDSAATDQLQLHGSEPLTSGDSRTSAQRAVLQAISAVAIPELRDDLLSLLVPLRNGLGMERFVRDYGLASTSLIDHALTLR
ncbi:TetR family transcriptional regulator [Leucobacter manosquensis]|uniref:TetR/AcrR family transcriptional regulator n=1 Tax=Leucobacter manosquensis TaxID=2810611 RepID=A0ABS5M2F5_9MICO|nr:TetR/AcrR family transcriptional regulator [Leucobacter manosquensis]